MKFSLVLIHFVFAAGAFAQNWEETPEIRLNNPAKISYVDTVDNLLYLGGLFGLNDIDTIRGVAVWDGLSLSPLGKGVNSWMGNALCGSNVNTIIRFQDKIFVGADGDFTVGDDIWTAGIGVWDLNTQTWDSLPGLRDEWGNGGGVNDMVIINNELYVVGSFQYAGGIAVNGIAKWNGTVWSSVYSLPNWGNLNNIKSIAYYENEIYLAGTMIDSSPYDTMYNICRYDGIQWVQLGEGIGGTFSWVEDMLVYDGLLYISGSFNKNDRPLNPGNRIVVWDGSYFAQFGDIEGLSASSFAAVRDIVVHENELIAVGQFENVNGTTVNNLVKYDGTYWCSYGDIFDNPLWCAASYNGDLFVSGYFLEINGSPFPLFAKLSSNATINNCESVLSVIEETQNSLSVFPNPSSGSFALQGDLEHSVSSVEVRDISGSLVCVFDYVTDELYISTKGLYFVHILNDEETLDIQKIIIK